MKGRDIVPPSSCDDGSGVPGIEISNSTLINSPTVPGDNNSLTFVTQNVGLRDQLADMRNEPSKIVELISEGGRALNTDRRVRRTVTTDGDITSIVVEPLTPDAAMRIDPAMPLLGGKTVGDYLRRALYTQEPVTISGPDAVALFPDDGIGRNVTNVEVTISQAANGPSVRHALIAQGSGARIDNLELQCYDRFSDDFLPTGWLRFTNRQQRDALLTLTLDIKPQIETVSDAPDGQAGANRDGNGITIESIEEWTLRVEGRSLAGCTIPQVLTVHDMKRALRTLEGLALYNYTSCISLPLIPRREDIDLAGNSEESEDAIDDRFMDALRVIQRAFPHLQFVMPEVLDDDDYRFVIHLASIIAKGHESGTIAPPRITVSAGWACDLPDDGLINATIGQVCTADLWGTAIDLGKASIDLGRLRIAQDVPSLKAYAARLRKSDPIIIDLVAADVGDILAVRQFEKFSRS